MKNIIYMVYLLLVLSCNSKTDNKSKILNEQPTTKEIKPVNPCDLFNEEWLTSVFNISDPSTIEMYARERYGTTKQCQFIWPEEKGSIVGSQIMIDISSKSDDMGATFSRMLELDLQKGLTASENGKVITILPTAIVGFGDHAYHWTQPDFQQVQKIVFQVEDSYKVEITYTAHKQAKLSAEGAKNKLIEIGNLIQNKLK